MNIIISENRNEREKSDEKRKGQKHPPLRSLPLRRSTRNSKVEDIDFDDALDVVTNTINDEIKDYNQAVKSIFEGDKTFSGRMFDENGKIDLRIEEIWGIMDYKLPGLLSLLKNILLSEKKKKNTAGKSQSNQLLCHFLL